MTASRTEATPDTTPTVNRLVNTVHSKESTPCSSCHTRVNSCFMLMLLVLDGPGSLVMAQLCCALDATGLTGAFAIIGTTHTKRKFGARNPSLSIISDYCTGI